MWQTVQPSALQATLSAPELAAFKTVALEDGQAEPLQEIIDQTVEEVRGYISAGSFALGAAGTVPFKLMRSTLCVIRYRLITRLPIRSPELLEQRRREFEDAQRLFERVAEGKFQIEEPEVTDPSEPPPRGRSGSCRKLRFF